MENQSKRHIDTYISQADSLRFKLWAVIGKDEYKTQQIISYLETKNWSTIDVGKELAPMYEELEGNIEPNYDVGQKIKLWFNDLPDNIILVNTSILYSSEFEKITPIGAFKYNSRNKRGVIFLQEESLVGNRIYYGDVGSEEYSDEEIRDIIFTAIDQIQDDYSPLAKEDKVDYSKAKLDKDAIGNLFNYTTIKDVVDIDTDLKQEVL